MSHSHLAALGKCLRKVSFFCCVATLAATVSIHEANATPAKRQVTKVSESKVVAKRADPKKVVAQKRSVVRQAAIVPMRPSFGQLAGLHGAQDALDLKSSVALVIDQNTSEVLFSKNEQAVLPIASLTKLMTGLVVSQAHLSMEEMVTITQADVDTEKGSSSRLRVGTELSRGELLHLALMSSENRAANALGRTFPGGLAAFVSLMNAKAQLLGMSDTKYVEPTGLSSKNQSSATECLVMQAKVAGRMVIMVFLDSAGKLSRLGDAERVRRWVESIPAVQPGGSVTIGVMKASAL
jgi:D-alanyl-D-alanine endopeptidase (penicillin-binding protein 7)